MLQALAQQQPLLLPLDDLQWADAGSISLLFHLGRRLENSRILIVGSYWPSDVTLERNGNRHPLEPVINEFARHIGRVQVNLSGRVVGGTADALNDSRREKPRLLSMGMWLSGCRCRMVYVTQIKRL